MQQPARQEPQHSKSLNSLFPLAPLLFPLIPRILPFLLLFLLPQKTRLSCPICLLFSLLFLPAALVLPAFFQVPLLLPWLWQATARIFSCLSLKAARLFLFCRIQGFFL